MILYVIKGTVFHLIFEKKKGETFFFAGDVPFKNKKSWEKKKVMMCPILVREGEARARSVFVFPSERIYVRLIDRSIERTNERA